MIGNRYFRNIILGAAALLAVLSSTTVSARVKEHDVRELDSFNAISYVETPQPDSSVTLGAGVKAGQTIGWKAPDGSAGDRILVTNVDYKNKTGTATVVWHKEAGKTIEIKDEYEYYGLTLKITAIADGACKANKKATSVIIGRNVKKIGKKAFYGLKKCNTLTIKSTKLTAKNVGKKAFGNMKKNIKVKVPKKKYKAYKKWLCKKGLSKKAALKKI
ncbi:MAG: leucine-rich repeat protein [Lachnospiraceae bacterium]|nr:leucine-rich repeat protein [Lachnospiraceae bacterium]